MTDHIIPVLCKCGKSDLVIDVDWEDDLYFVECGSCHKRTKTFNTMKEAQIGWNTLMEKPDV